MNYYEQIAEMLGVKLDEEFKTSITEAYVYKITEGGLRRRCHTDSEWFGSPPVTLTNLLRGDFSVVKLPWKPKTGERYWVCNPFQTTAQPSIWLPDTDDFCRWKAGNCFRTSEEAETKGKEIMEAIQKEFKEA